MKKNKTRNVGRIAALAFAFASMLGIINAGSASAVNYGDCDSKSGQEKTTCITNAKAEIDQLLSPRYDNYAGCSGNSSCVSTIESEINCSLWSGSSDAKSYCESLRTQVIGGTFRTAAADPAPGGGGGAGGNVTPVPSTSECTSLLNFLSCDPDDADGGGIKDIIQFVIGLLTMGIVVAGTIGIIWSGFLILSARDNEAQVASARKRILDIIIGLIVWGLAATIMNLIIPKSGSDINGEFSGVIVVNEKN